MYITGVFLFSISDSTNQNTRLPWIPAPITTVLGIEVMLQEPESRKTALQLGHLNQSYGFTGLIFGDIPKSNEPVWSIRICGWKPKKMLANDLPFTREVWGGILRFHVCFHGCATLSKSLSLSSPMRSPSTLSISVSNVAELPNHPIYWLSVEPAKLEWCSHGANEPIFHVDTIGWPSFILTWSIAKFPNL